MSKKMKLNLDELRVQSFVTALTLDKKDELNGGIRSPQPPTQFSICTCLVFGCFPDDYTLLC